MGYDAKGVDSGRPYGVVVRARAAAAAAVPESETLVCKLNETRLLFEDPEATPTYWSYGGCKIRTDCHVSGRLSAAGSREDLELWLTSQENIPLAAKEDILRLVFEEEEEEEEEEVICLLIRVDWFKSGSDSDNDGDDEFEYWGEESADAEEEEYSDKDGPTSEEGMDRLEKVATTTTTTEEGCPICLEEGFSADKEVVRLPCSHLFHTRCIHPWLYEHCYCPMCRYKLPIETFKDYPCLCEEYCIDNVHFGCKSWVPDHPPPYYKFY